MKSSEQLERETRAVQFNFLMADMATGNTFLDVSQTTRDPETRARNIEHARLAFTTIARLSARVAMTTEQDLEFHEKLKALELRLESLEQEPHPSSAS